MGKWIKEQAGVAWVRLAYKVEGERRKELLIAEPADADEILAVLNAMDGLKAPEGETVKGLFADLVQGFRDAQSEWHETAMKAAPSQAGYAEGARDVAGRTADILERHFARWQQEDKGA